MNRSVLLSLFFCLCLCKNAQEWKSRSIYQLLTDRFARGDGNNSGCNLSNYCGGNFRGIINKLDYIQNMGFNAIWISPIVDNTDGGYHGYWARNFYQINSHWGSANEFKEMIAECHKRDIWVMVDVVGNHVGPVNYNYGSISPFNQQSHYHDCNGCPSNCEIKDWNNQWQVEHCRLAGLPDLNHENSYVYNELLNWIRWMTKEFGVDGYRIDTVPEAPKGFWRDFNNAAGVFCMGEAFNGDPNYVGDYQNYMDSLLDYPTYYTLRDVFMNSYSMYNIESRIGQMKSKFKDISVLGTFLDNHDNARWLNSRGDYWRYKGAITYGILASGIPIIYYGTEQGYAGGNDPNNREALWSSNYNTNHELYKHIAKLNYIRNTFKTYNNDQVQRYADNNFYAFSKGSVFVAMTNSNNNISKQITYHPFSNGQRVCNVFNDSDCITVNGSFTVYLNNGESKVYVPK